MNNIQQIVRIFTPALKGAPFIIGLVAICIFIASKIVYYATPLYECTGRMKLEDVNLGISNTNLYKDFDVFEHPGKIMTEVEVIKSSELIKRTVSSLPFDVTYYRIGKIRTTELFDESPFTVKYNLSNHLLYGEKFLLKIDQNLKLHLSFTIKGKPHNINTIFNEKIKLPGGEIEIFLNDSIIKNKANQDYTGEFYFTINSLEQMVSEVSKNLDVKELDKEIQIVRIIYKHPIPKKAMMLTNRHMEAYIEDGILFKQNVATKTVKFVDNQMAAIEKKLSDSEQDLERFRLAHKITNTRMEVETDLKKLAELKIQLTNLEMNLASLDTLNDYVNLKNPDEFLEKAPNYEGYGGLLYTELMKRIKSLQSDRKDLLQRFKPESDEIRALDEKINDVIKYIKQNIANARKSMEIQRDNIADAIYVCEEEFNDVPTKEKNMVILERNFQLNQAIFKFLNEKRTEAEIAKAATLSFHRIIERATLPEKPVSPKKTFTMLVFAFLGLLFGIILVYIYDAISARIKYKDQLEKSSNFPVLADIRFESTGKPSMNDFLSLATKLYIKSKEPMVYTVCSSIDKEGKSFVSEKLTIAFAKMGIKSLCIKGDLRDKTSKRGMLGFENYIVNNAPLDDCIEAGLVKNNFVMHQGSSGLIPEAVLANDNLLPKIIELKKQFKVIVFDTPSFDTSLDAIPLIKASDLTLYLFKANYSKLKQGLDPDLMAAEYKLKNLALVLNGVENFTKMKKGRGIRRTISFYSNRILRRLKSIINIKLGK